MDELPGNRTPRVIPLENGFELRPATISKAEIWFPTARANRERLRTWLAWAIPDFTLADIRSFLEKSEAENRNGTALTMGIWSADTFCGGIGLHQIEQTNRSSSLGYWLDREFEGTGLATLATSAIVTEGFERYNLHRIEIRCATGNDRSCAIPRRLGFVEEGILREAQLLNDKWVDLRVFSVLEQDWQHVAPLS